jgi:hypothetical protein
MQTFLKKQKNQDYHIWIKKKCNDNKEIDKKTAKKKVKKDDPKPIQG